MIDLILCGVAYTVMVYFMIVLMKRRIRPMRNDDDDDGGINVSTLPDLDDLPPGVSLPLGGPSNRKKHIKTEEPEEVLA